MEGSGTPFGVQVLLGFVPVDRPLPPPDTPATGCHSFGMKTGIWEEWEEWDTGDESIGEVVSGRENDKHAAPLGLFRFFCSSTINMSLRWSWFGF